MTLQSCVETWWTWVTAASWQLALFMFLTAIATFLLRGARPGVRYGLWLLVLVKIFLPTSLSAPWSVTNLFDDHSTAILKDTFALNSTSAAADVKSPGLVGDTESHDVSAVGWLFIVWIAGVFVSSILVVVQYVRIARKTRQLPIVEEGPVRVAFEKAVLQLRIKSPPELRITEEDTSPFLIGTFQPSIVVPKSLVDFSAGSDLNAVLTHELVHWKHGDTWVGFLQVFLQCVMWFHPCVWLTNAFVNHERETVCDEAVLRSGDVAAESYGETILRVLKLARGRSLVIGSLVGIFERGGRIQNRLESIMSYDSNQKQRTPAAYVAVIAFAIMFMPLARWGSPSRIVAATPEPASVAKPSPAEDTKPQIKQPNTKPTARTPYPQIVKIEPAPGSTDVDPSVKEIRVTFDRDMGQGMSWTGGGPEFPPVDKSRKVGWVDKKTCVLPVTLKRGSYYRVGVNSKSHLNFRSTDGKPVPPAAIFFTTKGASKAQQNRVRIPKIVEISPANGATDVSPSTNEIRVTFNMPMGGGMSWTGGGEAFPNVPQGKRAAWSKDGRTCTLPVSLKPNHEYRLGLNSLSHNNFQSKWGVPSNPVTYSFATSAAKQ